MSVQTTGSKPRSLIPGIDIMFGDAYSLLKPLHDKVYMKKISKKHMEEAVQLVGGGPASILGEGDAIEVDATREGVTRRTLHTVWHKAFKITDVAFQDDLYRDQAKLFSEEIAKSLFDAKESNAAALFNNAISTSAPYVSADGKAFLATDHVTGNGGTYSNLVSADFSELALENAIIQMGGWTDDSGRLMDATVKALLIPRQLVFNAHRVLKSVGRSGTAERDTNALNDRNDIPAILEWRYLDTATDWFVLTNQKGLCYYERQNKVMRYFMDDYTHDHVYEASERYSFDHYDQRSVIGYAS